LMFRYLTKIRVVTIEGINICGMVAEGSSCPIVPSDTPPLITQEEPVLQTEKISYQLWPFDIDGAVAKRDSEPA